MSKMNLITESWKKFLKEATLQRVTSKADGAEGVTDDLSTLVHKAKNGALFLISDSELKHVKEQHKKVGTGSVLHPSINIESIVQQIENLPLKAGQIFYQIKVPNAGYRLVIDKAEAQQMKAMLQQKGVQFTEDTVKKPEAGGFIDVPRLNIKADLKDPIFNGLVTNLLDVLLPTVDFNKIYGATPQEKEFAMKHVKKVINSGTKYKQAYKEGKLFTFVTAFPTKEGFTVPKPSEWKGNFYIVYPAGASAEQSVKEMKVKYSKLQKEFSKINENDMLDSMSKKEICDKLGVKYFEDYDYAEDETFYNELARDLYDNKGIQIDTDRGLGHIKDEIVKLLENPVEENIKENKMKISKQYLKQVIKEELEKTLNEEDKVATALGLSHGYSPEQFIQAATQLISTKDPQEFEKLKSISSELETRIVNLTQKLNKDPSSREQLKQLRMDLLHAASPRKASYLQGQQSKRKDFSDKAKEQSQGTSGNYYKQGISGYTRGM